MTINNEASGLHKQAAGQHEEAAKFHKSAAELHEQNKMSDAKVSSQKAMECCQSAQKTSESACGCSSK